MTVTTFGGGWTELVSKAVPSVALVLSEKPQMGISVVVTSKRGDGSAIEAQIHIVPYSYIYEIGKVVKLTWRNANHGRDGHIIIPGIHRRRAVG